MKTWSIRAALLLVAAVVIPACGSSGGGAGGPNFAGNVSVGGQLISQKGGTGGTGQGGDGGNMYLEAYTRGNSGIWRSGTIDSRRTAPVAKPDLGANPRTISTNTVYTLGAASLTTVTDSVTTIYGDDGATVATGLWVKPGVTLTLPAHIDPNVALTFERVELNFAAGIFIEGTINIGLVTGSTLNRADLWLGADYLVIKAGAKINLQGVNNLAGAGGNGGDFDTYSGAAVRELCVNAGTIDTSGGDGTTQGGTAGGIDLNADNYSCYNSGTLIANGGDATAGPGGAGGWGYIECYSEGGAVNSGTVTAKGGNGTTFGGSGDDWYIGGYGNATGALNSGTFDLSGGNASAGDGGSGGDFDMESVGSAIRATGRITSKGGTGAGAGGDGGNGGNVYLDSYESGGSYGGYADMTFGIFFGAALELSGGNGAAAGGDAGDVEAYADSNQVQYGSQPNEGGVQFIGYGTINAAAGNGATGGVGGYVEVYNYGGYTEAFADDGVATPVDFEVGSVINEAAINGSGGNGTAGAGGGGGGLYMAVYPYDPNTGNYYYNVPDYSRSASNSGVLTMKGGDGTTTGALAGEFGLEEALAAINTASVNTTGGAGGSGVGGAGEYCEVYGDGLARNSGAWTGNGGNSTGGVGGAGGNFFYVYGNRTESLAGISANGGNGTTGGAGGYIEINGMEGVTIRGTYQAKVGTGGTPALGTIWIEGMLLGVDSASF